MYSLKWEAEAISIQVDRMKEDSKGNVSGEILVLHAQSEDGSHLHQARLNLTSTTSRRTLANLLTTRLDTIDWFVLLEQACVQVLRRLREGEPVIDLSTVDWRLTEKALIGRRNADGSVDTVIASGLPSVIFAAGGLGKSWVAIYLATLLDTGFSTEQFEVQPTKVLYLDWEANKEQLAKRQHYVLSGLDLEPPEQSIQYRRMTQSLEDAVPELMRVISTSGIELVVIDSAVPATGEAELSKSVSSFFNAIASLKTASLIIAHTAKGNEGHKTPFGSVFFENIPRALYHLKSATSDDGDTLHLALHNTKVNGQKLIRPIALSLAFGDEMVTVSPSTLDDVPEFHADLPLRQRIQLALEDGAKSIRDLADELDSDRDSVRTTLNRHKGKIFTRLTSAGEPIWGNIKLET